MREIICEYNNCSMYKTSGDSVFGNDKQLKIIIKPHKFSIAIGDEVLRDTSCDGYEIIVSNEGAAAFYDKESNLICEVEKSNASYKEVRIYFENNTVSLQFGFLDVIDHYPNCDGEYDRWDRRWIPERKVELNINDSSIKTI